MIRLILLLLCLSLTLFAEDRPKEPAKHEDPAEVSLSKDQQTQIELISSQFREAVAMEESAKAKKESAQLRYVLAVTQFRASLKITDDYQFDEATKKFFKKPEKVTKSD